ncbi:unnamed protein product [Closterium sp. Naga37s-1]|nr:unnamed protein product [Closterium sp. Naga37s-1]
MLHNTFRLFEGTPVTSARLPSFHSSLARFPCPFSLLPSLRTLRFGIAIPLPPPPRRGAVRMATVDVHDSGDLPAQHHGLQVRCPFLSACPANPSRCRPRLLGPVNQHLRGSYDFEEQFARAHAGAIFTFDPFLKPAVEEQMRDLPFLSFRAIGLSGEADLQTYRRKNPTKLFVTLARLLALMNHTYVDVFKIDCEGCELEVIKDMTASYGSQPAKLAIHGGALPFGQILMEFHQ